MYRTDQKHPARTIGGSEIRRAAALEERLESLDQLREAGFVTVVKLEPAGIDTRRNTRQPLSRGAGAICKCRINRLARATPTRATLLRGPLGGTHRQTFLRDPPRKPSASVVLWQRKDCPRVALREITARKHPENVLGELEQPNSIRDGRLRATDAVCHLAERELEFVDQRRIGTGLFDRREVLASDVLDETEEERIAVADVTHDRRDRGDAGFPGRPPAALTGDQLIAAFSARPDDDGL